MDDGHVFIPPEIGQAQRREQAAALIREATTEPEPEFKPNRAQRRHVARQLARRMRKTK